MQFVSYDEPREVICTAPVTCHACGSTWDEDDEGDQFDMIDGEVFCNRHSGSTCAAEQNAKRFKAEALDVMKAHINAMRDELVALQESYPCDADKLNPFTVIEEAEERTALYAGPVVAKPLPRTLNGYAPRLIGGVN